MEIINKFVLFEKYCSTCIHKDKKDHEDPCNECLENAVNTQSEKPVMYNSKLKTTTNNNTNVQYIKVYPELENITVVPSLEEQKIKSKNYYGINEVTVTAIEGEELSVIPSTEKQTYEGLYTTVNVEGFDKGTDTTDATATAEDILEGKTAYVNDNKITGTMSNNGTLNYISSIQDQTIPAGYTSGGTIEGVTASINENIKPENIKKDVEILGVVGSLEESSGDSLEITNSAYLFYSENRLNMLPEFIKTFKGLTKTDNMFYLCGNLGTSFELLLFDTSKVTSMINMFYGCSNLTTTPLFDTGNVTNMSSMFYNCSNLEEVPEFNTSSVTNMSSMFQYCFKLKTLPLFNTCNVTNMSSMFKACNNLEIIPLFDTSNVLSMGNMFESCLKITTLPQFNTGNVRSTINMFKSCGKLTTVPQLNASNVRELKDMFIGCLNLTNFGGLLDLGKSFNQKSNNYSYYKFELLPCSNLTHESLMNVINGLYDLNLTYNVANGGKLYTQSLVLGSTNLAKLTDDEIAIATAKGWTVS